MTTYRGSRKHVLDWVESPDFLQDLTTLLRPTGAVPVADTFLPKDSSTPKEARLEWYGPQYLPRALDWTAVQDWWLVHKRGANTPNWDMAAVATMGTKRGLVLVEAKANVEELKSEGKRPSKGASSHAKENHKRIGRAIAEAREGLTCILPGVEISIGSHYQLANRLAFAWKLASLGVPVVLMYLGFYGDTGIQDIGVPFMDKHHWVTTFTQHAAPVAPSALFDRRLDVNGTPLWILVRSRPVLEPSPPR